VVRFPLAPQPGNHRWRQVRGLLAEQCGKRFLEVAHRHPAQVEDRQQRIQAPRPPRPARQDRRGEADTICASLANSTVAQLWTLHLHGANPGLHLALRPMAVPDDALASVRQSLAFHRRQKRVGFGLDGLGQ